MLAEFFLLCFFLLLKEGSTWRISPQTSLPWIISTIFNVDDPTVIILFNDDYYVNYGSSHYLHKEIRSKEKPISMKKHVKVLILEK